MTNSFKTLALNPALFTNLESLRLSEMTPIQVQALPLVLEGHDLISQALILCLTHEHQN
jgi:ATP-independent RNA helicase DbpA